jgi:hypothetical protein
MGKVLKIVGRIVGLAILLVFGGVGWLAVRSPALRPASTETFERTPERLARGQYIVEHVSDCAGCHSDHDYDRFGIPVKAKTRFQGGFPFDKTYGVPGVVCAQNLTPDKETGKGSWTDGEILRAFREGVSRDGHAVFPMMPYAYYRSMSDEDAKSVVVFLRSVPAIHNVIAPTSIAFPVNLFIKFEPKPVDQPIVTPDDGKDHLGYGQYLVTIAGCRECHTAHDDKGKRIPGGDYAGGWEMKGPWGRVVTANITPDPETSYVGRATKEEFIARFKSFAALDGDKAPRVAPGNNTVMSWAAYGGMTEKDLGAIYDFLKTVRPVKHVVDSFPDRK